MTNHGPTEETKCPHCGAAVGKKWKFCWLCNEPLEEDFANDPPLPDVVDASRTNLFSILTKVVVAFVAIGVVLAVVGLTLQGDFGAIPILFIVVTPPSIYTFVKYLDSRKKGGPEQSALHHIGVFVSSLAVTVACGVLLVTALAIAFFVACLAICAMSGGFR